MYAYNVLLTNTCSMYEINMLLLLLLLMQEMKDFDGYALSMQFLQLLIH